MDNIPMKEVQLFNKILLPVDLTNDPEKVIASGLAISKWSGGQLIILHAYRLIMNQHFTPKKSDIKKNLEAQASHLFKSIEEQKLAKSLVAYQFFSEVGFMTDRIIANANGRGVDLVVLHESVAKNINQEEHVGYEELKNNIQCPIMIT